MYICIRKIKKKQNNKNYNLITLRGKALSNTKDMTPAKRARITNREPRSNTSSMIHVSARHSLSGPSKITFHANRANDVVSRCDRRQVSQPCDGAGIRRGETLIRGDIQWHS